MCSEPVRGRESDPLFETHEDGVQRSRRGRTPRPHAALSRLLRLREEGDRSGASVLVRRHPGTGGGTLVRELVLYARVRRDLVTFAGPHPTGAPIPYYAARPLLAGLLELHPDATEVEARAAAARIGLEGDAFVGVEEIFRPRGVDGLGAATRQLVAGRALRVAASTQAARSAVLAVVEQLDRCDPLSRRAFAALAKPPLPPGLLLIGMEPPGGETAWPGAWSVDLTEGRRLDQAALHDVFASRVERLPLVARRFLHAIAVLGHASRFDLSLLCGDDDEADLEGSLSLLVERGFVVESDDGVRFRQWIVRDLVLADTLDAVRADLHRRAAEIYKERNAPIELAAHHAVNAEGGFLVLVLLEEGGDEALRRGDHATAADLFARGVEIARRALADGEEAFEPAYAAMLFYRKLGRALLAAGERQRAGALLREALELGVGESAERREVGALLAEVENPMWSGPMRATPTGLTRVKSESPPKGMPI